jgi:DNA-binding PadR family transcriptional regulator
MARKRKVDNLLALAVLSTVFSRPMHRYEMASIMKARGKDRDMDIKWGSLYTVVQNMEKHGFLEAVGSSRQGARPERTTYRITEAGVAEMLDWTRELLSSPEPEHPRFAAGLSVLAALPPREVAALLAERLERLEQQLSAQQAAREQLAAELPRLFALEDEYRMALLEAEIAWVRSLTAELTDGTMPDLPMWQAWHDTGEIPPELAELAERGALPD